MGLVSLDPLDLKVKSMGGEEGDREAAATLLTILDDSEEQTSISHDGYTPLTHDDIEAQRNATQRSRCRASRHHFVLVTFLLFNSIANEALPLFLDALVPSWLAIVLSVTLVLFFGEIIPSAIFTGPNQLRIAAAMAPVVKIIMLVLSPIAYPIAYCLDVALGHQSLRKYTRNEISALVRVQHEMRKQREALARSSEDGVVVTPVRSRGKGMSRLSSVPEGGGGKLTRGSSMTIHGPSENPHGEQEISSDEVDIVAGVLQTAEKKVYEAMTPISEVYSVGMDRVMDFQTMSEVMGSGFSRIPVSASDDPGDMRGFLLVKRLITLDPDDAREIKTLRVILPACVSPNASLLETLNKFQEGRSHMAFVSAKPQDTRDLLLRGEPLVGSARPIGILTLEDIVEKIIQEEIYDEDDLMIREVHDVLSERLVAWRHMLAKGNKPKRRTTKVFRNNKNFQSVEGKGGNLRVNKEGLEELTCVLNKNLVEHLLQAFKLFDRDSDGQITAEELDQVLRSFGQTPTPEELQAMISVVDTDGDGSVDFQEFVEMIAMAGDHDNEAAESKAEESKETVAPPSPQHGGRRKKKKKDKV
uniref:Uncharacterized protein n=1 Tax=Phaeomonas parva TaxID=124430 RepID=A0A6U4FEE5_9STRA